MKIKVCGMRENQNILALRELRPDYMGFIFFKGSKRFVNSFDKALIPALEGIKKTAVFVNAPMSQVQEVVTHFQFEAVQLHGQESPEYCAQLKENCGVELIKAFGIKDAVQWEEMSAYRASADYFLFDTFTESHGGSGKVFNWGVLKEYPFSTPYFLSGGLGVEQVQKAYSLKDDRLYGVDLNSRFELEPGIKNIKLLETIFRNNKDE